MKANRNNYGAFYNLVSAMLIVLAAIAFNALPVSASINAEGNLSFNKKAFADEANKADGKIIMTNASVVRPSVSSGSHASANSVVGLLAIYKQKLNSNGSFNKNKVSTLNHKIAALEMDLSNPHLDINERKLIEKDLTAAETELEIIIHSQEMYAGRSMAQKIRHLLGFGAGHENAGRENNEIDMMEASGKPD